jgi:hypothetical protein
LIFGIAIFVLILALAWYGSKRLICHQEYQRIEPMMIGEYRCSWRESGYTYARVNIEVRDGWRWRLVWDGRAQGISSSYLDKALPDKLRKLYTEEVCAYIAYRDAWAKENGVLDGKVVPGTALKRS